MRLTEREIRRGVRAALLEADDRYTGWEGYAMNWQAPIPARIMDALVKICGETATHIKQNYPPPPRAALPIYDEGAVDPLDAWGDALRRAVRGDPVVERATMGCISLFKSMLPGDLRTHVTTEEPSPEMEDARLAFLRTVAHPFRSFRGDPEGAVKALLGVLALTWSGYTARQGLLFEADRYAGWDGYAPSWKTPIPPRILSAVVKVCSEMEAYIEKKYPPAPRGSDDEDVDVDARHEELMRVLRHDPVVNQGLLACIALFRALLPGDLRTHVSTEPSYEMVSARHYFLQTVAHPYRPFRDRPTGGARDLLTLFAIVWAGYTSRLGLISEGSNYEEGLWFDFQNRLWNRDFDRRFISAIFKVCQGAESHIHALYPPPVVEPDHPYVSPYDKSSTAWTLREWEKEVRLAAMEDPQVGAALSKILALYKVMLPGELRLTLDAPSDESMRHLRDVFVGLITAPERRFTSRMADYLVIDILVHITEAHMLAAGISPV